MCCGRTHAERLIRGDAPIDESTAAKRNRNSTSPFPVAIAGDVAVGESEVAGVCCLEMDSVRRNARASCDCG